MMASIFFMRRPASLAPQLNPVIARVPDAFPPAVDHPAGCTTTNGKSPAILLIASAHAPRHASGRFGSPDDEAINST
jgi:hypothetical protein